jgi:hypothetical protein
MSSSSYGHLGGVRPMKSWSVEDVQEWALQHLDLTSEDIDIIKRHRIDGECWESLTRDNCLQIGMAFGSAVKFVKYQKPRQSYEDVQSLLQLLLLVTALLLSFALSLLTGSKTLDDFLTADRRQVRTFTLFFSIHRFAQNSVYL